MISIEQVDYYISLAVQECTANEYFDEAKSESDLIANTFSDKCPDWLLKERPKETTEQKDFRKDLYERLGNNIKGYKRRILSLIKGINNVSDYAVLYNDDKGFNNYLSKQYPLYRDYVKSFWEIIPKTIIDDPNAVMYALPNPQGEKLYNIPQIYYAECKNVLAYKEGSIVAVVSNRKSDLVDSTGKVTKKQKGKIVIIIDNDSYVIATQVNDISKNVNGKYTTAFNITGLHQIHNGEESIDVLIPPKHNCLTMPAQIIGVYKDKISEDGQILCKSIISDGIPDIRRGISLSMDLAIEYALHSATEEWRTVSESCKSCNGTGTVGFGSDQKKCGNKDCYNGRLFPQGNLGNGLGVKYIPNFAVSNSDLPSSSSRGGQIPVIGGFIERNHKSAEIFAKALDTHIQRAFMWTSMEYLFRNQIQQSAEHKRIDKEDSEHFMLMIANHICKNLLEPSIQWLCCMREPTLINTAEKEKIMPTIRIPTRFNLESADVLFEKIKLANKDRIERNIVNKLILEYFAKEFGVNSEEYKRERLSIDVNPLSGMSDLEKARATPTLEWWQNVLSTQVDYFIDQAVRDDFNFLNKTEQEQFAVLEAKAKAVAELTKENLNREYPIRPQVVTNFQK